METTKAVRVEEGAIISAESLAYAEAFAFEDVHSQTARKRAEEFGVAAIGTASATVLSLMAGLVNARAIVEVGTGTGVSTLALMHGMAPDGMLTSVDLEAEHQRAARKTFTEADVPSQRYRLIPGAALDVLPRLTDNGYDMAFIDGDKIEYPDYLAAAENLVRPGGVIVFDNVLWHDRVADHSHRDPDTTAIRDMLTQAFDHEGLRSVLLPVGDGLLVAHVTDTANHG